MTIDERDAWLEWRRAGIGASDVAGILGLSPWSSPYSIWATKVGLIPDDDMTEAMEMGLALEPAINALFHTRTGLHVVGAQSTFQREDVPWARATLDGMVPTDGTNTTVGDLDGFEAKTTSDAPAKWEQEIPVYYSAQVHWQMYVTGMSKTWLGVIHANYGLKFRVYEVKRNEDDIAYIVGKVTEFYNDHVLTGIPPATDGTLATTEALNMLPVDPGAAVDIASSAFTLASLRRIRADLAGLETAEQAAINELKASMGEATEALVDGEVVATWRPQDRTSVDTKALKAELPDVFDTYSKTTTSRVFRLSTKKEK